MCKNGMNMVVMLLCVACAREIRSRVGDSTGVAILSYHLPLFARGAQPASRKLRWTGDITTLRFYAIGCALPPTCLQGPLSHNHPKSRSNIHVFTK
jgi:hypothetical protein